MKTTAPATSLDLKQLRRDATQQRRTSAADRPSAFGVIRSALGAIDGLRADGCSWAAIAAALGEQGVTQGIGDSLRPITSDRLRSIVTQIRQAEKVNEEKRRTKLGRADLAKPDQEARRSDKVSLSSELGVKPSSDRAMPAEFDDEEMIRRRAFEKMQNDFLKPG